MKSVGFAGLVSNNYCLAPHHNIDRFPTIHTHAFTHMQGTERITGTAKNAALVTRFLRMRRTNVWIEHWNQTVLYVWSTYSHPYV